MVFILCLELSKLFLCSGSLGHLENIKSYSLAQRSAFTDGDCVSYGNISVISQMNIRFELVSEVKD